jgi:probable O-glycosylation ligase (exosortase A-associated)
MRDMLFLVILVATVIATLRRPWIGALAWAVVSIASPHMYWAYAAASWPVAMVVAVPTIIGLLITKQRINPFQFRVITLYALLFAWITIGFPFSFVPDFCYDKWDRTMKISVMLLISAALLNSRMKVEVFLVANALSVGMYGIKGGLFTIMTGGGGTVLGPGGFIGENNAMALANVMTVPLFHYMQQRAENKWLKRALGVAMILVAIAALGSNSRGALLGVICMGGYFWLKSDKKFQWGLAIAVSVALVFAIMPDSYFERMNTINDYEQDDSSLGRINSWWAAFNIANHNFFGGGFTTNIAWVYELYAPNPKLLLVEHSIYFQMLGEFGWIGLALFLSLGAMTWRNAMLLIRLGKTRPELAWARMLGSTIQVSMVGYASAGAFLSMALFDMPYNIMVIAALALHYARQEAQGLATKASTEPLKPAPIPNGLVSKPGPRVRGERSF